MIDAIQGSFIAVKGSLAWRRFRRCCPVTNEQPQEFFSFQNSGVMPTSNRGRLRDVAQLEKIPLSQAFIWLPSTATATGWFRMASSSWAQPVAFLYPQILTFGLKLWQFFFSPSQGYKELVVRPYLVAQMQELSILPPEQPVLPSLVEQSITCCTDSSTTSLLLIKCRLSMAPTAEKAQPERQLEPWSLTSPTAPLATQSISSSSFLPLCQKSQDCTASKEVRKRDLNSSSVRAVHLLIPQRQELSGLEL